MQSKRFNRFSIGVISAVAILVIIWIADQAIRITPLAIETRTATSTEQIVMPTSQASTTTTETIAPTDQPLSILDIKTPKGIVHARVADTPQASERGLSGTVSLPKDAGMLFIFVVPGKYGFWMKDMNYPIDMVWIGADKKVLGIARDVKPESYPEVFYPPSPMSYVLELNSGGARDHDIATGTKLVF
jgi:uncharacterized protein